MLKTLLHPLRHHTLKKHFFSGKNIGMKILGRKAQDQKPNVNFLFSTVVP